MHRIISETNLNGGSVFWQTIVNPKRQLISCTGLELMIQLTQHWWTTFSYLCKKDRSSNRAVSRILQLIEQIIAHKWPDHFKSFSTPNYCTRNDKFSSKRKENGPVTILQKGSIKINSHLYSVTCSHAAKFLTAWVTSYCRANLSVMQG